MSRVVADGLHELVVVGKPSPAKWALEGRKYKEITGGQVWRVRGMGDILHVDS